MVTSDNNSEGASLLKAKGFVQLPRSIEIIVNSPLRNKSNRHFRRSLLQSRRKWNTAACGLELAPLSAWSTESIDTLYFEVIVKLLYTRGWSPFGIHNYQSFLDLLDDDCWIALVCDGSKIIGGGLLTTRMSGSQRLLAGNIDSGPMIIGQVYALASELLGGQRAFLFELINAAANLGFASVSLGSDLPWTQFDYVATLIEKLNWGTAVTFDDSPVSLFAAFENCGDDIMYFERTASGLNLAGPERFKPYIDRFSARLVRLVGDKWVCK